jgi:hypothetical protein
LDRSLSMRCHLARITTHSLLPGESRTRSSSIRNNRHIFDMILTPCRTRSGPGRAPDDVSIAAGVCRAAIRR